MAPLVFFNLFKGIMSYQILSIEQQNLFELSEIKNYLRISHDYDDALIKELIDCSINSAENFLRQKLLATRIENLSHYLVDAEIKLPFTPVALINRVIAHDEIDIIISPENYILNNAIIKFKNIPRFKYITTEYIAGYIDQSTIPSSIKQGIMLHIAEMYESHGASFSISGEVQKLYQPYRKMMI